MNLPCTGVKGSLPGIDEFKFEATFKPGKIDHVMRIICQYNCLQAEGVPVLGKCKQCFVSHFPRPNTKLCKYRKDKRNSETIVNPAPFQLPSFGSIHLRGGSKKDDETESLIISRSVSNGISLHAGVKNLADGNCAFESIIDSINTRPEFEELMEGTPDYWRKKWMGEVELVAYDKWNGGLSIEEWVTGWQTLKESGTYENKLGDLVLPGIAHCTKKDILIFNTSIDAHHPIYVVEASMLCGQVANIEVPVCLAYDQNHYEMLVPDSPEDIQKTITLKQEFLAGNYLRKMIDLPFIRKEITSSDKRKSISGEDSPLADAPKEKKQKLNEEDICEEVLKSLRVLGGKKRSVEQERQYNTLMRGKLRTLKKLQKSDIEIETEKRNNAERRKQLRERQTAEAKAKEKLKQKIKKGQEKVKNALFELAIKVDTADFNENESDLFKYNNIGSIFKQSSCKHCYAYRWPHPLESQNSCCKEGKLLQSVKPYKVPPKPLCKLLQDKAFCDHIKEYNNALAFASLGIDKAPEIGPNFKILGKLHHKIGSIGSPTESKPKFAQLYHSDLARHGSKKQSLCKVIQGSLGYLL